MQQNGLYGVLTLYIILEGSGVTSKLLFIYGVTILPVSTRTSSGYQWCYRYVIRASLDFSLA